MSLRTTAIGLVLLGLALGVCVGVLGHGPAAAVLAVLGVGGGLTLWAFSRIQNASPASPRVDPSALRGQSAIELMLRSMPPAEWGLEWTPERWGSWVDDVVATSKTVGQEQDMAMALVLHGAPVKLLTFMQSQDIWPQDWFYMLDRALVEGKDLTAELVNFFLEAGASPDFNNIPPFGWGVRSTPVTAPPYHLWPLAQALGHHQGILDALSARGANHQWPAMEQMDVLSWGLKWEWPLTVVYRLMEAGFASPAALLTAITEGQEVEVDLLLSFGVDPTVPVGDVSSAAFLAARVVDAAMMGLMLEHTDAAGRQVLWEQHFSPLSGEPEVRAALQQWSEALDEGISQLTEAGYAVDLAAPEHLDQIPDAFDNGFWWTLVRSGQVGGESMRLLALGSQSHPRLEETLGLVWQARSQAKYGLPFVP